MKRALLFLTLFCFVSLHSRFASAQEPVYRMLDYAGGLPSNTVYNVLQDNKGYIWISHDKGLSRYNGSQLKNYSSSMVQSRGLSNLEEDRFGRIWCQNFSGDIFYTVGDSLQSFNKIKPTGNFISFTAYQKRKIITVRKDLLLAYDVDTKQTESLLSGNRKYSQTNILAAGNEIFALSPGELVHFKELKHIATYSIPSSINPMMCAKAGDKVFIFPRIGTDYAGILIGGIITPVKLNIGSIIQHVSVVNSELWVATTEGLYTFDFNLQPLNNGAPMFPDCNFSKAIIDVDGTIWLSTLNRGVIIIPNIKVKKIPLAANSFTSAGYFSSTDRIILGTGDNRLFEFNPQNNSARQLYNFDIKHEVITMYNDVQNDRIWVSSDKMYAIRGGTNTIEYKKQFALKDMVYLGEKTYATAAPEGVSLFTFEGDTAHNTFSSLFLNQGRPWQRGHQILQGSEGRAKCVGYENLSQTLYGSNYKGLYVWAPNYRGVITDNGEPIYASDILVKGTKVFIVTYSGKLYVLQNRKIIRTIRGFPGLERKSITALESKGDYLWLLYENAIVKYDVFTDNFQVFRASDGLPNTEIKDMVVYNDQVYLATRLGMISFPENISRAHSKPRLEIEDVYVNNKRIESKDNEFDLATSENNLEVRFSIISYKGKSDIRAYYQVNEKDWIPIAQGVEHLSLAGLSPGKYFIRIKIIGLDGTEVISPTVLKFYIQSPLWMRWWFILLVVVLLGFLAYSFMRFRITELRKEAEYKAAKERLERELQLSTLASIKSQMNPHFVFNALNTVQSFIFMNDKDNAIDYLNKFSDLTRMILDMSTSEKVTLAEEIRALNLYLDLEKERFEDNFEYNLIVNENISTELVQIPSMLIQPYVENAIKHGLLHKKGMRTLKIEFLQENNSLTVFIDDNGIGRKRSFEMKSAKPTGHKSFATEANKKRLQLLNQGRKNSIDIEYLDKTDGFGNADGTMVILSIPLHF